MRRIAIYSCIALLIIVQGCRKDLPPTHTAHPGADTLSLTLDAAKKWLDGQPAPAATKTGNSVNRAFSVRQLSIPWDKARTYSNRTNNYWIAPTDGEPVFSKYIKGYRKIVFFRTGPGAITARLLEIIPDGLYWQQKQQAKTADFTGRLFIYDLDYHLLGGKIFSGGKIAGEIKPQNDHTQSNSLHTDNMQTITACDWYDNNYVNADGEVVIYSERICSTTTVDDGQDGFDGGTGDYLGSESGGGSGPSTGPPPVSSLPGETGPAVNPKSLMSCFGNIPDAGAKCTVTVYVVEPFPGTTFNIGPNSVGHTALGLTKTNGAQSITQVVGYYPDASGFAKLHAPSKVVDNGGDLNYNVSIRYDVSVSNFQKILNYVAEPPATYDLISFNCTDFVYFACQRGNITLPNPVNTFGVDAAGNGLQQGMSPAGLGNSIEKMKGQNNVNTTGGTTPFSKGPCTN